MKEPPHPSTAFNGSPHRLMLGNVMQDAESVRKQCDAVYYPTMSSAGHNLYHTQNNQLFTDQQHRAVQSDTQSSRVMRDPSLSATQTSVWLDMQ